MGGPSVPRWMWVVVVVVTVVGGVRGAPSTSSLPSCPRSCSCPQPTELHCTFRSLHSVPAGINKHVERINLGFNAIHTLTERSLAGLGRLELLMMHGNNIHELPQRAFTDLSSLQMLKMSYNKLVELERDALHGLWSLQRLHLDHNLLDFLHPDAFQGLTSLRLLQLEGNRLQRLHPDTFCTFSLMGGHLHASTLRHLHLSDNALTTLDPALLATMPRLENLYLQGNPWTCDCRMRWLHHWDSVVSPGVLKCKKDRAYAGGQLCPLCSSPKRLRGKELSAAAEQSMVCSGPVITRPAAATASSRQGAPEDAADDTEVLSAQEFRDPLGNVSLGLSDEHGNQVDLSCSVGPPRELARVEWEQVDLLHLAANVSVSVDLDCPVDRDSYELLWRLIAYYSDTPAHLRRDATQSGGQPRPSYTYRQDMERDALYYTGVRANMAAVPPWLMQSQVDLQLDRPGSTGKSARLVLRTRLTQSVQAEMERRQQRSWVSIDSSNATRTALSAVAGGAAHLDCRVRSSEPAAVRWVLPDGTRVPAPSGGGPGHRVSVSAEGRLDFSAVRHSDAGVYYCMAALRGDLSVLPFRLAVEESSSPPPGGDVEESLPVRGFVGEAVSLPCHVVAGSPDPRVDWILPGGDVVSLATDNSSSSSSSRAAPVVLSNGTLRLPRAQASDGGYYKCVAVNVHGADSLATKVTLSRRAGGGATPPGASARPLRKIPPRPPQSAAGLNTKVRVPTRVEDDEGGSGDEVASEEEEEEEEGVKQRGGGVQSKGRGVGGVHPSRTMWRRPAPPQRRPAVAPNANNNERRSGGVQETNRRRTGVSNNKIDPAKWAHILAKIRDRSAQSNATTTATASPTAAGWGEEGGGGEGGRRAPSRNNVEGSSEVDNAEAETAAPPPATTQRHGEDRGAGVTPDGHNHGGTHNASRGKQPAQGSARFTPDTRRKAAKESARDSTTARASPPLLPSPASVTSQRPVTDRQIGSSSSSVAYDGSVQQRQRVVTAAVDAVTATSDSARTSSHHPESSSGQHRHVSDPPPTTDEPPQAVTEDGEQDENDERVTDLDPEDTKHDNGKSSQAPPTTVVVSPTTAPARRLSGKKGTRGRGGGGGGGGSARRDRPPSSRRRGGNGNGGGRRKPRPDRRKPRPERPGSTTTVVASTPAEEEFPTATAPTRLKIDRWGKQAAAANVNSAVPLAGGQATTTSPDPLSHTAQSTVSGADGTPASEPTAPTPTPPPASLPPLLTKHSLLPPAKPQAATLPFFPTTSPRGAGGRGRQTVAPGGGASASETVPTMPANARQRFLTSAPLPSPVKPLEETGRTWGGSVVAGGGDPLGPAPRATGEPARSAGPPPAGRGQPDVGRSYAPTEAVGEMMLPLTESNERLFSSAAPSVQSGSRRPSGSESASDSTPPITTTTTAAEGVLYEEDAADATKKPALSESSRPRPDEGRTTAHVPSEGDVSSREETTPAAAKQPPQSPQSGGKPLLHAAVPASTPVGGRTLGSGTTAVTREGPKFNQIPDSHGERGRRPEHRAPLSPAGRDPPLVVVIGSRPEPERASRPATHSGGQDIVVVHSSTTKPPKATGAQAVKQTTTTVHPARADASRPGASTWPVDASRSRAPPQTASGGSQRLPGTGSASRGRPRIANASAGRTVTVPAQEDAQLPCEALGVPMPFLSWTRVSTGTSVAQNTRLQRLEVHPNGTLVIRAAQPSDRGQYLCTVQNQYGSDKALVTLAVLTQHPRVLQPRHRDATVPLGGAVDLECSVAGHPPPRVTWVLPDRVHLSVSPPVIPPSQRVALFDNGTLRISQASYADRGVYKCIGSSPVGADTASVRLHVTLLPPLILQGATEDNHAALPEGGAAYLDCTARGTPPPAVRWTTPQGVTLAPSQFAGRDNVLVFPNGTLLVRSLTAASAGRYECVASSSLASSKRTVTLTVARILSSSPQRTDVLYGGMVRLDCLATGRPEPRIIWRTPSKKLVDSQYSFDPRIKVFANGTLTVRAATEADAGDYLCVARNKMGDDYVLLRAGVLSRAAKIQRKRPQSPSGQQEVVAYGADLKVDCVASGLPDPEISWALPDGTMLNPNKMQQADEAAARPGAGRSRRYVVFDNGTLYLNEVGMREEGDYTCYAQNQLGTDQMKVRVKVEAASEQRAPRVQERPAPVVVRVPYGGTATLNCSAEGEPPPTLSWTSPTHRDIPPTPSDKYQVLPGGTLVVHKAQRFDGGNYTCTARNAAGTDRRVITVEVLVTPPTISGAAAADDGVVRVTALGDQRVTVACTASGLPLPRLTWVLPGNVVLPAPYHGGRVTVHRNGTLDIRAARPADAGRLACVARNEGGEARLAVQLDVREESTAERPQVRGPPVAAAAAAHVSLPLTVGKAMTLNCSLEGIVGGGLLPPRHVTWLLPGGTPLLSGARFSKFFHRPWDGALVISNPSLAESGVYRCLGRGAAGPLERTVTLEPGRKPHISNRYDSAVSVLSGEDLLLHCVVSEDGDVDAPRLPRLTWTLPSGVVLGRPQRAGRYAVLANGTLAVRQASVYDRGAYACRVANEYGGALLSATVAVLAFPPRITSSTGSVVYARRGVAVQLNCAASGTPRAEVAWETPDRARLAVSGQPRLYGNKYLHPQGALVIQNPTARDAGVYRCTARNAVGLDSRTTYLNVF